MDVVTVERVLEKAVILGEKYIVNGCLQYSDSSRVNEEQMLNLIKEAALEEGVDDELFKLKGGHTFPDIEVKNTQVGIELKGAKSGKVFNGNSIYGSTLIPGLQKIYLFYWIDADKVIGWRDYFECVDTPVVTHSPRFRVNPYLPITESMFGIGADKVGLVEEIIFHSDGVRVDKILEWMNRRAREAGERAWWISEDNISNTALKIGTNGLTTYEKSKITMEGFLLFPEVFSNNQDKFYSFIAWAISVYGIVLDRDFYTAGGKKVVVIHSQKYLVSQILYRFLDYLNICDEAIKQPFKFGLLSLNQEDFPEPLKQVKNEKEFFRLYIKIIKQNDMHHLYSPDSGLILQSDERERFWEKVEERIVNLVETFFVFNSK